MTLPPGLLDELRTRTSLAQVVGRKVSWDMRKSNQGKGDMWAPCPFHQEKTASFHVDDRKGFYYCFGCHAKGDAISFVQETENVGFMEAIEILAREAGLQMPARDPKAQEKADRRGELAEVMEQAVQFYRLQLKTAQGAAAREYLDRRGLRAAAQERWGIGYAPDARHTLIGHFRDKGVDEAVVVEAGLAIKPDDGGAAFDRFRGRIIFPIRDGRGRAISLGGRALDPNARAKYLNGPETELFDKGRSLFNLQNARAAAGKGTPLIVAEGYMDVIALVEAGFGATVAPLGTAITEDQLRLLWRIAPEPVIALDGDAAGLRAAMRVIDLALPMLEAGQSLRFAIMPEGQDPDDVIRAGGAEAMRRVLEAAQPMAALLWRRETEDRVFDSPERRAALDARLRQALGRIGDASIRSHYIEEMKRLRADLFGAARPAAGAQRGGGPRGGAWQGRRAAPAAPLPATRDSALARGGADAVEDRLREAVVLAVALTHPAILPDFETQLERLDCAAPEHRAILAAILAAAPGAGADPAALRDAVRGALSDDSLEKLMALRHVQITPAIRRKGDTELAAMTMAEELAKLEARRGARREIDDAVEDLEGLADEGVTWRLSQAAEALNGARRTSADDKAEYDIAQSGARIDRAERRDFEALLANIDYAKARKGR